MPWNHDPTARRIADESSPRRFPARRRRIAATLNGLLLVGVFFYVETGFRRATTVAPQGGPFLRATTKLTLLLYSLVLGISLGVVVLRPVPLLVLYGLLGLALLKTPRWRERV